MKRNVRFIAILIHLYRETVIVAVADIKRYTIKFYPELNEFNASL